MKYVVVGDYVRSKKDGQLHYVNARTLCDLYKIDWRECKLFETIDRTFNTQFHAYMRQYPKLQVLTPRYKGDYSL